MHPARRIIDGSLLALLAGACTPIPVPVPGAADVNRDGVIDFGDLLLLLAAWGAC